MDSFIGEVRIFGFDYAPVDWAFCDGQRVPISQYQALYGVIGNTFGGDGRTYFNLPNLPGLVVMGTGAGPGLTVRDIGEVVGTPAVALAVAQMPPHEHSLNAAVETSPPQDTKVTAAPGPDTFIDRKLRKTPDGKYTISKSFSTQEGGAEKVMLHPSSIGVAGTSAPHENRQPYLAMNYCISLQGEWPPRPE